MTAVFAIVWFTTIYCLGGIWYLVNCYLPYEDDILQQFATVMENTWNEMIESLGQEGARNFIRVVMFCIWPYGLYKYLRMS